MEKEIKQEIKIEYVSSLVGHEVPLEPIDITKNKKFKAAVGVNYLPLLFFIGSDGAFHFATTQNEKGTSADWSNHNLSAVLGDKITITDFNVVQDDQTKEKEFTIFLATLDANKVPHFYRTNKLPQNFDGKKIDKSFWKELKLHSSIQGSKINGIYFDNAGSIITTLGSDSSGVKDAECYYIDDSTCQELKLPFNASQIKSVKIGQLQEPEWVSAVAGCFMLYEAGAEPQIIFLPFPNQHKAISKSLFLYQLPYDFLKSVNTEQNNKNAIYVLPPPAANKSSILYVVGNGIAECTFYTADCCKIIVQPVQGITYKEVLVVGSGDHRTLYVVQETAGQVSALSQTDNYTKNGKLSKKEGNNTNTDSWLPLMAFATDIVEFDSVLIEDPITNQPVNHLVAVDNTGNVQHLIQTPTKGWTTTPIFIPSDKTRDVTGYAAFITIGTEDQAEQILGKSIFITGSVDATLLIDDASYRVGPNIPPAEIVLKSNSFYAEYYSDELTSLVLYVTSPSLFEEKQAIAIDLAQDLCEDLRTFGSADALKKATKKDGTPFIPRDNLGKGKLDDEFLTNLAQVLQALLEFRQDLIQKQFGKNVQLPSGGNKPPGEDAKRTKVTDKEKEFGKEIAVVEGTKIIVKAAKVARAAGKELTETVIKKLGKEPIKIILKLAVKNAARAALAETIAPLLAVPGLDIAGAVIELYCLCDFIMDIQKIQNAPTIELNINEEKAELTFKINGQINTSLLTSDLSIIKIILLIFRSIGVPDSEEEFKKRNKHEYTCDVGIDTSGAKAGKPSAQPKASLNKASPSTQQEDDVPLSQQVSTSSFMVTGVGVGISVGQEEFFTKQDRTCAIGAVVGVIVKVEVKDSKEVTLPAKVESSFWNVYGRQIDLSKPIEQNLARGEGNFAWDPFISDLFEFKIGNGGDVDLAWLQTGEQSVTVEGIANDGIKNFPYWQKSLFNVVGPEILANQIKAEYISDEVKIGINKNNKELEVGSGFRVECKNNDISVPQSPGPGGRDVLEGGEIGFIQVAWFINQCGKDLVRGTLQGSPSNLELTNDAALDIDKKKELFYVSKKIKNGYQDIEFEDTPALSLPTSTWGSYTFYSNQDYFVVSIAFKAPVKQGSGVKDSYIVTNSTWKWGWCAAVKVKNRILGSLTGYDWEFDLKHPKLSVPKQLKCEFINMKKNLWNLPIWKNNTVQEEWPLIKIKSEELPLMDRFKEA